MDGDFEVQFVGHARHAANQTNPFYAEPGSWSFSYTLSGEHVWRFPRAEITGRPGVIAVYRRFQPPGDPDWQPKSWEGFYARFDPPSPRWAPPSTYAHVAASAYRAEITSLPIRQRVEEIFVRMLSDASARLAVRALRAAGSAHLVSGPENDTVWSELLRIQLRELLLLPEADPGARNAVDPRVRDTLQLMSSDLLARHTLSSLARASRLSRSRLAHLFQEQLGTSPIRALRQMRLRQAALHLRFSDYSVEAIAEMTGFSSLSHLSREFRREFHVGPRAYRSAPAGGRTS